MISLKQKHKGFLERKKRLFDKLFTLGIKLHKIIMLKRDVEIQKTKDGMLKGWLQYTSIQRHHIL